MIKYTTFRSKPITWNSTRKKTTTRLPVLNTTRKNIHLTTLPQLWNKNHIKISSHKEFSKSLEERKSVYDKVENQINKIMLNFL